MAKGPAKLGRSRPLFNKPEHARTPDPIEEREFEPDFSLLDEQTKEKLTLEAKSKAEANAIKLAEDAWLEAEIKRAEKSFHPEAFEEMQEIEIDVALYADRIILDNKTYMHGRKYTVKKSVADCMREIMSRTERHWREVNRDPARMQMEADQAIAKGGKPYATISAASGQVTRF